MGKLWSASDSPDVANLNSPVTFDARVSASASGTLGTTYQTVAAALAAGKRSIFVEPGDYAAGFTITANNVRVFCAVPPGYDGGFQGCTFGGQVTVSGNFCHLENVHVVGSSGYGIRVDMGLFGTRLINCTVYQSTLTGFSLSYDGATDAASFDNECRGCVANDCGGSLYDGFYIGDYDFDLEWLLDGCRSFSNGRDGFMVCNNGLTPATAVNRIVQLTNCFSYNNAVHGLRCGGHASVQVTGGNYRANGSAGIYLSTQASALARSQIMGARVRSNVGAGVQLQAVSSSQIVLGVFAYGNGTNFINCGSALGFSTCNNGV